MPPEKRPVILFCDRNSSAAIAVEVLRKKYPGKDIRDCATRPDAQSVLDELAESGQKVDAAILEAEFLSDGIPQAIVGNNPEARLAVYSFSDLLNIREIDDFRGASSGRSREELAHHPRNPDVVGFVRDLAAGRRKEYEGVRYDAFIDKLGRVGVPEQLDNFILRRPVGASGARGARR